MADDYRLPKGEQHLPAHGQTGATDGYALLGAVYAEAASTWLHEVPAVETLR